MTNLSSVQMCSVQTQTVSTVCYMFSSNAVAVDIQSVEQIIYAPLLNSVGFTTTKNNLLQPFLAHKRRA